MKKSKKSLKILSVAFLSMFALTGCATVSNIPNDNNDLIFNGGQAVQVGDYLYFGNGYTAVGNSSTDFAYDENAKVSYMNRINLTNNFGKPLDAQTNTEKVNSQVAGYENQYMFVLGDFVYYTSANTHWVTGDDNVRKHAYNLVSFFRSRLNGDGVQEIFTSATFDAEKSEFRVLKGSDDNYYFIVFDGNELSSIKLGNSLGERKVLAKDVQSLALPDEDDTFGFKEIVYTINKEQSNSTSTTEIEVHSVDYATGVDTKATSSAAGTKFIGRQGDVVFYTNTTTQGGYQTYYKTLTSSSLVFSGNQQEVFYDTASIKNIQLISEGDAQSEGYIFIGGNSGSVMYRNNKTGQVSSEPLISSDSYSDLLFVDGDYVYYSNSTGIYRRSVKSAEAETVVVMEDMISGKYAYSNNYIYFYAKLEKDEYDEKEYEEDNNYYMYRVHNSGIGGYQIISNFTREEITED